MNKERKPRRWWVCMDTDGRIYSWGYDTKSEAMAERFYAWHGTEPMSMKVIRVEEVLPKPRRKG